MSENVYRKLQKQLDQYSLGFPATESGIEIKILKSLFTGCLSFRSRTFPGTWPRW
jgi:hypothetical protein